MNWANYHLFEKTEEIRSELGKLDVKINCLLNSIESVKKQIHSISFRYKRSYHKAFYMNFNSVSNLCDYRMELQLQHFNCNRTLDNYYNELKKCNKQYILLTNNFVYYSLLLNK